MKYILITAARSHPELNPKVNTFDVLKDHYELDKKYKQPFYFITYTDLPKVGINPVNRYETPIGIYTYPLRFIYPKVIKKKVPFANNRDYIQLLERTTDSMLLSQFYYEQQYQKDKDKLEIYYNKFKSKSGSNNDKNIQRHLSKYSIYLDIPIQRSWSNICSISDKLASQRTGESNASAIWEIWALTHVLALFIAKSDFTVKWNSILQYLGYEIIIDKGIGFIHSNEPVQALFLQKSACSLVEKLVNPDRIKDTFFTYLRQHNIKFTKQSHKLIINNDIDLEDSKIKKLPDDLTINGNLNLRHAGIEYLPKNLTVNGTLDLSETLVEQLPTSLKVAKDLILATSRIKKLPEGLTVTGNLDLSGVNMKELPDNLTVHGTLDLEGAYVNKLPNGLIVDKNLRLYGTDLTKEDVPKDAIIKGKILED